MRASNLRKNAVVTTERLEFVLVAENVKSII